MQHSCHPLILLCLCLALLPGRADEFGPGNRIDTLTVGPTTYRNIVVMSVNARTLVIRHADGLASVHLRDLPAVWQERFHYDPVAEAAANAELQKAPVRIIRNPPVKKTVSRFDSLLRQFGQPASLQADVDLRQKYFKLELGVKNQGRRPSCAIFAIVSALEFQNAELIGEAEKFSEEYLIWATRRSVKRTLAPAADAEDADEGFALGEVVEALRAYGIPLQSTMPNTFGHSLATIEDPPANVVEEARDHQRVHVHHVPGRDNDTRINNIVLALNAGLPVPVGMAWPNYRTLRTGYLSGQKPLPGGGHAVTIVGYSSPTGRIGDAVFIFKNSWGVAWGQGGYGTVTYNYLVKHLHDAVVLEVLTATNN